MSITNEDKSDVKSADQQALSLATRLSGKWGVLVVCFITVAGLWFSGQMTLSAAFVAYALVLAASLLVGGTSDVETQADPIPAPSTDIIPGSSELPRTDQITEDFGLVIDTLPEPAVLIDGTAAILHFNASFAATFPNTTADTSALVKFRAPEVQNAVRNGITFRKPSKIEFSSRSAGQENRFSVSVVPVGSDALCMMHFRDLSEARRLEKMRSDFVGNASHELRTPLTSLKGYLETLSGAARNDPEARERFIAIMLEQADRMDRLISDLLSLSRMETASGRSSFGPVNLADVLFHVRSALNPTAQKRGVTLNFDDEQLLSASLRVSGDSDELIQVFENLIENGIKYGRKDGQVDVLIEPDVKEYGRMCVRVSVKDDGEGIKPEHIPRLTERFYRVDVQTSRELQGTGLGLAIVKHILWRHDGDMTITSKLGFGSTFTITLPLIPEMSEKVQKTEA
ncbi:MAG: ATP-binding protein [Pseudomonadota bacterium]